MGKKTQLHTAAERGESEELQRLLETGVYDIHEGSNEEFCLGVCEEREGEVTTYSLFLLIFTLWLVCDE